jgi:hypothetical protein
MSVYPLNIRGGENEVHNLSSPANWSLVGHRPLCGSFRKLVGIWEGNDSLVVCLFALSCVNVLKTVPSS